MFFTEEEQEKMKVDDLVSRKCDKLLNEKLEKIISNNPCVELSSDVGITFGVSINC